MGQRLDRPLPLGNLLPLALRRLALRLALSVHLLLLAQLQLQQNPLEDLRLDSLQHSAKLQRWEQEHHLRSGQLLRQHQRATHLAQRAPLEPKLNPLALVRLELPLLLASRSKRSKDLRLGTRRHLAHSRSSRQVRVPLANRLLHLEHQQHRSRWQRLLPLVSPARLDKHSHLLHLAPLLSAQEHRAAALRLAHLELLSHPPLRLHSAAAPAVQAALGPSVEATQAPPLEVAVVEEGLERHSSRRAPQLQRPLSTPLRNLRQRRKI